MLISVLLWILPATHDNDGRKQVCIKLFPYLMYLCSCFVTLEFKAHLLHVSDWTECQGLHSRACPANGTMVTSKWSQFLLCLLVVVGFYISMKFHFFILLFSLCRSVDVFVMPKFLKMYKTNIIFLRSC